MLILGGASVRPQLSVCVTVKVCPAIVNVPDRAGPVVAATLNCTEPLPLPVPPLVIVIQSAWLAALQPQPSGAVTLTLPVPPADGTVWDCGLMANVHPDACEMVTVLSATVTVPLRAPPVEAAIWSVTAPVPLPVADPTTEIHGALLVAVQPQPCAAATWITALPPAAGAECVSGATSNEQPVD